MKYRLTACTGFVVLALATFCGIAYYKKHAPGATYGAYEKIHSGMTEDDVAALLGRRRDETTTDDLKKARFAAVWRNEELSPEGYRPAFIVVGLDDHSRVAWKAIHIGIFFKLGSWIYSHETESFEDERPAAR